MVVDSSIPVNLDAYPQSMEERHVEDAYHSLSIEGYKASRDLIKQVRMAILSRSVNSC
jgi:hypothetical protein